MYFSSLIRVLFLYFNLFFIYSRIRFNLFFDSFTNENREYKIYKVRRRKVVGHFILVQKRKKSMQVMQKTEKTQKNHINKHICGYFLTQN